MHMHEEVSAAEKLSRERKRVSKSLNASRVSPWLRFAFPWLCTNNNYRDRRKLKNDAGRRGAASARKMRKVMKERSQSLRRKIPGIPGIATETGTGTRIRIRIRTSGSQRRRRRRKRTICPPGQHQCLRMIRVK